VLLLLRRMFLKEFYCQWLGSGCYRLTAAEVAELALNTQ